MTSCFVKSVVRGFLFLAIVISSFLMSEDSPKICLTMIIKNERAIIERCLSRVKDFVDCMCICDTGSTDNTVEVVEKYLHQNSIPGKVYRHTWKNFGYNRSLSAKAAQELIPQLGFSLKSTYMLLLDADMVLVIPDTFNKRELTQGAYLLKQKNGALSYYNLRLLRASLPWSCIGPTHEYWSSPVAHREENLDSLWIDDRNDGGCKSDKFERDIRLLKQGLEEDPNNERYMFYLAQSYMCLNRHDEAIEWYQKRIQKGGFPEEVWYAKLMIGNCFVGKNDWDQALHWYLEAFQTRPTRAEPLALISRHYLDMGMNELAYCFAKKAATIPYPSRDCLFIADSVYNYELDRDISIAAFYCQNGREDGFAALDRLILKKTTPDSLRSLAYDNLRFYLKPLDNMTLHPIVFSVPPLHAESNRTYVPTNPSILKTDTGYTVLCRTVNYVQEKGANHHSVDPQDPTIRTKNFLLTYSKDLKLLSQKEILEQPFRKKQENARVVGLEDCRLFLNPKEPYKMGFTCTTYDTHPNFVPQITLCTLNETKDVCCVDKFVPLQGPNPNRCEKNWLPFYKDGQLHVVYSYEPFVIYRVDGEGGQCIQALSYAPQHKFSHFRGSAGPIPFDGGYLVIVHEVSFPGQRERIYSHRFVFLDKEFMVKKVSHPFTFKHTGVEFCCGMTLDHEENNLLITCGIEDSSAYIASVDVKTVRAALHDLP